MIKKLFISLILIVLLFNIFSYRPVYSAVTTDLDVHQYLIDIYESRWNSFLLHCTGLFLAQSDLWASVKSNILDQVPNKIMYLSDYAIESDGYIRCYFYVVNPLTSFTNTSYNINGFTSNFTYMAKLYNAANNKGLTKITYSFSKSTQTGSVYSTSNQTIHIPTDYFDLQSGNGSSNLYIPDSVLNFVEFINSPSGGSGSGSIDYNQLKDIIVEALEEAGASASDISSIATSVENIATNSEATAEAVNELNDFLNAPSTTTSTDMSNQISGNNSDYNNNIDIPSDSNPNNTISSVINSFSSSFNYDDTVSTISIPVPFTDNKYIVFSSDIISRYIVDTPIYTIIQLVYIFIFAKYFIRLSKRILDWLDRGEAFTEGGFSKFMAYLSEQNTVINASLM